VASREAGRFDVFDDAFNAVAPTLYGTPVRWISQKKMYDLFQRQPSWFVADEAGDHQNRVTNSRKLSETISSGYLRSDVRLLKRRLWLVAGVRYERTDVEGRGPRDDINAQYQRRPDGSFVRNAAGQRVLITSDALALRQLRFVERGAHNKRHYDDWFPSVNATYDITESLILRAGYARTIGRPNITLIIPGANIGDPDAANPTITVTNTALMPWTADNFDLSLESYQIKDGVGSVGVFRKNIKNFSAAVRTAATPELLELYGLETDPTLLNYEISTRTNLGDATIDGFEFSYRQSLTFLPNWARGLQVFVNATRLSLSGSNSADFGSFTPESYAGGVNFVRSRYFVKFSFTHQPAARRGLVAASAANGIPADTYDYQSSRTRWSRSVQYNLSKRYAFYGAMTDLSGNFTPMTYRYAPGTPEHARGRMRQSLGTYVTFGVKGSL
jgi:TonB-dependent receptor